jgi:ABC-2 type transport system permease protein
MRGPSAIGEDPRRFLRLTWTLAITTFKLRFYGSVLGYVWQLMRPLLLFGVLYVVFTEFVRLGGDVRFYPVVLLTGIVLFTFMAEATTGAVTSVVDREALLRKVEFPRMAIPCSVVLTAMLNLGLNLVVIVIFATLSGVDLHPSVWQVPLILAIVVGFALGVGLLMSALYVRYRDMRPISEVFLQVLFYGTPLLYPIEVVPESVRGWMLLNPLALANQQMRHAVIDPTAPSALEVAGTGRFLGGLGVVAVLLVAGLLTFRRRSRTMAEEL